VRDPSTARSCSSLPRADPLEPTSAAAEQDRDDVELDLVDAVSDEVLGDHLGTASHDDVLAAGRLPRLLQR